MMALLGIGLFAFGLCLARLQSFMLFHSLLELLGMGIAFSIFILGWSARRYTSNSFLPFLGISYLFVGVAGLIHTLAYEGMGVFPAYEADLSAQFWIIGRYLEAEALLLAPLLFGRFLSLPLVIAGTAGAAALAILSTFIRDVSRHPFVEKAGFPPFHIGSEIAFISILCLGALLLLKKKKRMELPRVFSCGLLGGMIAAIFSNLCFAIAPDVYGIWNFIGHFLKFISYGFIFESLIAVGLASPFTLLFGASVPGKISWRKGRSLSATSIKES